jgi:hypothetical protein
MFWICWGFCVCCFQYQMTWNYFAVAKRFTCRAKLLFSLLEKEPLPAPPPPKKKLYHYVYGSRYTALSVLFVTTCHSWMVSLIYTGEVSEFTSWHGVLLSWWGFCAFFSLSCRMQCILKWTVFFCILCSLVFTVLIVSCCIIVWLTALLNKSRITKICVENV